MLRSEEEGVEVGHRMHNGIPLSIGNAAAWMPARLCRRSGFFKAKQQLTSRTSRCTANCEEGTLYWTSKNLNLNDDDDVRQQRQLSDRSCLPTRQYYTT